MDLLVLTVDGTLPCESERKLMWLLDSVAAHHCVYAFYEANSILQFQTAMEFDREDPQFLRFKNLGSAFPENYAYCRQ